MANFLLNTMLNQGLTRAAGTKTCESKHLR